MLAPRFLTPRPLATALVLTLNLAPNAYAACVSLTALGTAYNQNFNALATTGSANALALSGWSILETGGNANSSYAAGTGSASTGDTYSFGAAASTDRAFGGLQSGTLVPNIGACFINNTGSTISSLAVAYTGEQWRLGTAARTDAINFQYSTSATALNNGSWTGVSALNFTTPVTTTTGAKDGNAAANRAAKASTISALNIANGASFWIRWTDTNASGSDDGLAVDDFSLTPNGSAASAVNLSIGDISAVEGNSGASNYLFTVSLSSPAPAGGVSFTLSTADGTAVAGSDYTAGTLSNQTIPAGGTTYTFPVAVNGDLSLEGNETFLVNVSAVTNATVTDGQAVGTIVNDDSASACAASDTPIGQIQGNGATAALTGIRSVEGVVVGDYEGLTPALSGFYLQNTAANADANATTSDAIFVNNGGANSVSLGQVVQVTGTVAETSGQTEIRTPTIVACGTTDSIAPTSVMLPVPAAVGGVDYLERFEGMLVNFSQTLYVSELYQLGRFGEIVMSSGAKLAQPTNVAAPGVNALAVQAANNLNRIIVDDALQNQNPDPIVFARGGLGLSAANTLRGGDTATNLVGVMSYTWSGNAASPAAFRLRPLNALGGGAPNFVASNPRPDVPAMVNGVLKIASANLLNFFNTFTNCTMGVGGAASTANCRGAENQVEFDRQWPKTVENLIGTGAAVIVVNEMENDGYGSTSAIQFLVDKMNAKAGAGSYAFVNPDTGNGSNSLGTDAIKVGIIYKPSVVSKAGTTAVLNTGALGDYYTGTGTTGRNRPALAQAFQEIASGSRFIIVGNHLKSKGSACDTNTGLVTMTRSTTSVVNDVDALDGQGNCNLTRTAAAEELVAWLALNPTGTGDSDILIMGDLNSYAKEDPITAIKNAGYTNLIESHIGAAAYSYVFSGQWGYLDHALASASMTAQVQGVLEWHINADEPSVLDYNTNFKSAGQLSGLYAPNAFRTSDHDPIVIGVTLTGP